MLQRCGVQSLGEPQADAVRWPLNRAEALACLEAFIAHALPHFGDYEDAMASQAPRLFHSLLSFALNVKMLHPLEVLQRAEAAYHAGHAPLAAVEGFVRQILGWREYVRGIYWAHMPGYEQRNALGHHLPLPHWFWSGDTRMRCLQLVDSPVAADGARAPHPAADGDRQLCPAGRAGPRRDCTAGTWASTSTPSNGWSCPTPWA